MAGEVYDLSAHTYEDALKLCELVYDDPNASAEIDRLMTKWGRNKDWDTVIADWVNTPDQQEFQASLNKYKRYAGNGYVSPIKNQKGQTIAYETTQETSLTESLNSNSSPRATVKTPMQTNYEIVDNVPQTTFKTGVRETGKFVFGSVLPAVGAVSTGIWLGKKIDQALYDVLDLDVSVADFDRDLYEGLTTLDPLDRAVFKLLWGIDESTGQTTAYMDEDTLAYLSSVWQSIGALAPTIIETDISEIPAASFRQYDRWVAPLPNKLPSANGFTVRYYYSGYEEIDTWFDSDTQRTFLVKSPGGGSYLTAVVSKSGAPQFIRNGTVMNMVPSGTVSVGGVTYYVAQALRRPSSYYTVLTPDMGAVVENATSEFWDASNTDRYYDHALILWQGVREESSSVDGVSNQEGATIVDASNWTDQDSVKNSLRQQYPDAYNNAKHYDYTDDDGNNKTKTYIPVPLPDVFSPTGNNPTSGDSSQDRTGNTIINIPDELIDTITKIINNQPSPNTPSDGTPTNQPPTGSGESPTVVTPVGSASSLWKIYNPTQAQLDSFGSWLWSSNFVDQIKKLFNDPMQGIIGVHKVFASPDIGGSATIKVGYLDSEVSSNWVSDQYTTVNCGTVSLKEYFGNVFDYAPYTKVSLYLPFIGIVDLDVGDVMRASINVKYHVDVLTGACLADVKVDRDGCEAVLYQYSGSAIVTYPVSSGNYMGMVAGVLSVASGVAGTILSGGALAPALIGGAVGASHLHTDVSRSGGFSGCAGAMASKKPYLIISRPQTALADNFKHFTGFPANSHVVLNNCSGYTKVKSVYVGNMQIATDEEKDMIEAQLKAGVLI